MNSLKSLTNLSPKNSDVKKSNDIIFLSLFTLPPSWSIRIGYFGSLKIFLIDFVNLIVWSIVLIFLENSITPHGLYFLKKNFSLYESLVDLIPKINDLLLFIIF